jgi:hypothetical protein
MSASTCTGYRSVIVRKDAAGELLETVQLLETVLIDGNPVVLAEVVARAGEAPRSPWRLPTAGCATRRCLTVRGVRPRWWPVAACH